MRNSRPRRAGSVVVLAALTMLAMFMPAGAHATGTLDQQQTDTSGGAAGIFGPSFQDNGGSRAQTFTAMLSGGLDQVDLFIDNAQSSNLGPLTVEIRNVAGGAPGTTVLATASVPANTVPSVPGGFVAIPFGPPAPVTAGIQYAIVAYTGGANDYEWYVGSGDTYPFGGPFFSVSSPPSTWTSVTFDHAFKTYVVTPVDCSAAPPSGAIVGTTGNDLLTGTAGADVIFGLGGDDNIKGLGGNDTICAGPGGDYADGGDGDDTVDGGTGNDSVLGGNGNDKLFGRDGNDNLSGGAGNDTLDAGAGSDFCNGGADTDTGTGCEASSNIP